MTEQLTLETRARRTDPSSSHAAAQSVTDLTAKQQAVLRVAKVIGRFTLDGLVGRYHQEREWCIDESIPRQSDSGIRTRCHELVKAGKIIDSGERRVLITGRKAIVWGIA